MKIRSPWLIKAFGIAIAIGFKWWIGTVRYRYRSLGPRVDPRDPTLTGRYLYCLWHENIVLGLYHYAGPNVCVLVSQHADGQLLTEGCQQLGLRVVRGSTNRNGAEAILRLKKIEEIHLSITPDGPRGPRRIVQPGIIKVAALTGLPIVSVGLASRRPWRLKSWDLFCLPRPWSRARCVSSEPLFVPANADRAQLEHYRQRLQRAMDMVSSMAEQWADNGMWLDEWGPWSETDNMAAAAEVPKLAG